MEIFTLSLWAVMAWALPRWEEERLFKSKGRRLPSRKTLHSIEKAYFEMGRSDEEANRFNRAILNYEEAARLNPGFADAHFHLGRNYILAKRFRSSVKPLKRAIKLNPNQTVAYIYLGWVSKLLGNHKSAVDPLKKALWGHSESSPRFSGIKLIIVDNATGQEITIEFDGRNLVDPRLAVTFYRYGLAHIKLERYEEAIAELKESVKIDPQFFDAHYALGLAYEKVGKQDKAVEHYEKALKDRPQYSEAEFKLNKTHAVQAA
ncbi:MAG: tetratricopeptide repeat protein [Nitrospinae bacterium]|nr:tetratricopeptide repeat protein [Nitrospinota bacterium]